jgi:uncharacterized protein YybS (DUF2232 family)
MQEHYDTSFWDMVYQEFGVTDELDILSEGVQQIITPMPGIIVIITKEIYGKE